MCKHPTTTWLPHALARGLLLVALAVGQSTSADAFTDLYVFGDSLSDVGNTSASTFGLFPGSTYFEGRFSNGPVYSELLAQRLDVGTLTRSSAGGNNFAYGGAKTSGTSGVSGSFIDDLGEQVDDFLANRTADRDALYIVWAGANDLFDGQTDMSIPAGNIATDIERLYAAGARELLVMNLPRLGATPAYNGDPTTAATWNARSAAFNALLDTTLDALATSLVDSTLRQFDVEAAFDQVLANPGELNLTNISEPAAAGLEPGTLFYDRSQIVANPQEYLFWDSVHPTATMHAYLAAAIDEFLFPLAVDGDYNGDGLVDAADYTVWRDTLGSTTDLVADGDASGTIDAADYVVWRNNFAGAATPGATAVPEPALARALVALLTLAAVARGVAGGA